MNIDFLLQKRKVDKNGIILRKFAISRDELLVHVKNDGGRKSHFGPMNAIKAKQQQKMKHEMRVNKIRQEQHDKIQMRKLQHERELGEGGELHHKKKVEGVDMEAIISRANAASQKESNDSLFLSHLSKNRQNKYVKEIDDSHYEQIKNSYMEMLDQVRQEKACIFVSRDTYDKHFKDQTPYTNIPQEESETLAYGFIEDYW